jgi:dienelactone hydrolase
MNRAHPSTSIWAATLALLVVAALALAACGSGAAEGEDSASSSAPSASSTIPSFQDVKGGETESQSTLTVDIPAADAPFAAFKKMYVYDRSEPLDFNQIGAAGWGGARNQSIEYTSAGCAVTGSLAVPKGKGPFPVILMAAPGCKAFVYEHDIPALNSMGMAVLALDPPNLRDPYLDMEGIEEDAERYIEANARYVVDVRRALDLIETQPKLDSGRIGYVGFSWTGALGALLAGVDPRVKAYVLDYAGGTTKDVSAYGLAGRVQDPAQYLAHNRGAAFLFQYTKEDTSEDGEFAPEAVAELVARAPEPKLFQWVQGGHGAIFDSADNPGSRFHRAWLKKNL